MNILNLIKVVSTTILLYFFSTTILLAQPEAPTVMDIDVCEGQSTLITPMDPNGGATSSPMELVNITFDVAGEPYVASDMFNDGVNDHFNLTDGTDIANVSGTYSFQDGVNMFWAAEDVDDNGGNGQNPQTISLDPISILDLEDIQFCMDIAAGNTNTPGNSAYDALDNVNILYSIDGAASATGMCFSYLDGGDDFNEPLHHDPNCDGDGVDGVMLTTTAANFCFTIPAAEVMGAASISFVVSVAMNSGNEEVAFDNIVVSGTPILDGAITFNYYDIDPAGGGATPVATGATYDPMTTPAQSPAMFWVTTVENDPEAGTLESEASPLVITVSTSPIVDAGLDQNVCGLVDVVLVGSDLPTGATGLWSGGNGSFDDATIAGAIYTPSADDLNTCVTLTFTVMSGICDPASDEVNLYIVEEPESAEFSYLMDTICPGDGVLMPVHETGVDGFYELIAGDADSLALNSATGAIDIAASGLGEFVIQNTVSACGNLMISGVIDGPLSGGIPKAIELYAVNTVGNMASYSIGSANNGGGTDGEEFMFPAGGFAQGTYIYVASDSIAFEAFFGFKPDYVTPAALINGDDAIELFCNNKVVDLFGEIDVDGSGQPWDYLDGWAYRMNDEVPGFNSFDEATWTYSGVNALDGETMNASAAVPFPVGSFTTAYTGVCENEVFTQTISIGDFEAPVVICPSDMTISLDPGDCGAFAALPDPMAMDNCTDSLEFVYVSGPVNGDFMDKESSPYTVVYEATEENGNVITCSYMITVEEYDNPTSTMACNGAINVSLDESCETLVGADMLLEGGAYGCYEDYGVVAMYDGTQVGTTIQNTFGSGYSVILDNSIINTPIEISIIEIETGNSCWGTITLEDKLAPVIDSCNNIVLNCGDDFSPVEPSVTENCGDVYFELEEDVEVGGCQDTFSTQITRVWVAIDNEGNASEACTQVITILKDSFENLVLPVNYDDLAGNFNSLACDGAGETWAVNADGLPSATAVGILPGTGEPSLGFGCSEIISYYSDDIVPTCGNSYKVLRHWTIVDWCSGEVVEHIQVIKVLDQVAPEFNAPENITVAASVHCEGVYPLPLIPAIDNCGTASVSFSSNDGVIANGAFTVESLVLNTAYTLSANGIDECGNINAQEFTVTFADLTPPVVVAESSLTVTLTADGTAKIFAPSFDDGSFDACTDIGMSVLRNFSACAPIDEYAPAGDDNFQFNEAVHFCCSDVGETQMVTFRVCDDADDNDTFGSAGDNCNIVMVEVVVQDKTAPIITCPPFLTVNCVDVNGLDLQDNDLMNELFGTATVQNACSGNMIQNALFQESCGSGIVIRTFIASNTAGVTTCSQAIAVTQNSENQLSCDRIKFNGLSNNTYDWCDVNDNTNDNDDDLPALEIDCNDGFSAPALDIEIEGLCTEVGESITVDTFNFAGGACKKYLLHYEVVDQCVFDENYVDPTTGELDPFNSNNGYYEFYLEINAFDNEGPDFDPADREFAADDCVTAAVNVTEVASDNCTDAVYIAYQFRIDFGSDDSIDYPATGWANGNSFASGSNGLGVLPIGVHTVFWYLNDGCGNTSSATQLITITENEKEPTPYCKTGLKASLSAMGMVSVNASDFNAGSFDNCTAQEDLIYSFSTDVNDTERMYTCDDLGFQFIQVYVTDEDGNQDFCNTSFQVQDNGNFCGTTIVSGTITSDNDYVNKDAEVVMTDIETQITTVMTDDNGVYTMPIGMATESAVLSVEDNNDILRGVTTGDILSIQKHILGLDVFSSNAQYIAGDVNNSGGVTGADIIQIRKVILGHQDYFVNNNSWIAYPASFDIESLPNPFEYPSTLELNTASSYDFKSIKVADVNMSHSEFHSEEADTRGIYNMEYEVIKTDEGQKVNFYGKVADLAGLHLKFNNEVVASLLDVTSDVIQIDESNIGTRNGLEILWHNLATVSETSEAIFSISVANSFNFEEFMLNTENSEAFIGKGIETDLRKISIRERHAEFGDIASKVIVYPNPFAESINIDLTEVSSNTVVLSIFDVNGKLIHTMNSKGYDVVTIPGTRLNGPGVYYVQIENDDFSVNKKIIKID